MDKKSLCIGIWLLILLLGVSFSVAEEVEQISKQTSEETINPELQMFLSIFLSFLSILILSISFLFVLRKKAVWIWAMAQSIIVLIVILFLFSGITGLTIFHKTIIIWIFPVFTLIFLFIFFSTMITYSGKPNLFYLPFLVLFLLAIILIPIAEIYGGDEGYPLFILSIYLIMIILPLSIVALIFNVLKRKK